MIPSGWKHEGIGKHLDILSGFPFASEKFTPDADKGVPLIRIRDLLASSTATYFCGEYDPTYLVKLEDILIGMDGDFHIVKWQAKPALLNQRICKVSSHDETKLSTSFCYYLLQPQLLQLNADIAATTVKHLSTKHLKSIEVPLPPLPEQKRIAEVLGSVDAAIEATHAVIEQTKKVKQGLLQTLLTQGIGHTKFKQSPLGKIPESWEVKPLIQSLDFMTDFVANGSFASLKSGVTVNDGDGYAFYVRLYDLRRGLGHQDQKYVDKTSYDFLGKSKLVGNEILIANIGANVGEVFLMPIINKPATIAPNMIVLKVKPAVSHKYLYHFLRSDLGQKSISMAIAGSGQPKMNKTDLKKIWVICPPQNEQNIIADIFECLDGQSAAEMTKLTTLQQLKKGLMHDLLTGKVRVNG